jgi:hypothetical protein
MDTILREAAAGRATLVSWTLDQYHRAIVSGVVPEDSSVELLEGFIVRKDRAHAGDDPMTIGDRHRVAVVRLSHAAPRFEPHGCFLQTQQPVALPPNNEPEPDAAIIRGRLDDYLEFPPRAADTLAVIEVADSSLRLDLGPKLQAYARAGVPQYVVVNLVDDVVLVHERPAEGGYEDVTRLVRGDTLGVRTARQPVSIPVDQLLP